MLTRSLLLAGIAGGAILATAVVPAEAKLYPRFDRLEVKATGIPPTIRVVSEDGKTWTRIEKQNLPFAARVDIKTGKGEVATYALGHFGKVLAHSEFNIGLGQPKNDHVMDERSFEIASTGMGTVGVAMIGACNALLKTGAEIFSDHMLQGSWSTDIELEAQGHRVGNYLKRRASGSLPFNVKCVGVPIHNTEPDKPGKPPVAGTDELLPGKPLKVKSATLGIHRPKSNTCPQEAQLVALFSTNHDGKVTFIYRQAGGGKSQPITVMSKKLPNGKFAAIHKQLVPVKKATDTKYMVEAVGKGVISDWVRLNVPCKIALAGGDGLDQPPAEPLKVLSAQIGIVSPKTNACPAKAVLKAWFKTDKPGNVGFRLMLKGGAAGPMTFVKSVKSASGYLATYSRVIPITKPIDLSYAVVVPGQGGLSSAFAPLKAACKIGLPDNPKLKAASN